MIKRVVGAVAALALLAACGDSTEPRVPTAVQLDRQAVTLGVGDTLTVHAVVVDQQGRAYDTPPQGFPIQWSSNASGVATVSPAGLVTAIGSGTATIRATAGNLPPADLLVQSEGTLEVAGTLDLPLLSEDDSGDRVVTASFQAAFAGHRQGTIEVDATFPLSEMTLTGSYGYSIYNEEFDDLDFVAWENRSDGRLNYIEFYIDGGIDGTGTYAVYLGIFYLGYDVDTDTWEHVYVLDGQPGTLTLTGATGDQLVGSFDLEFEAEPVEAVMVASPALRTGDPRPAPARLRDRLR